MSQSAAEPIVDPAALQPIKDYLAALNRRDVEGIRIAFHFPHVQFRAGKVSYVATAADLTYAGFYERMAVQGWAHSTWDGYRVVLAGADKVHLDVWFTRWRPDGSAIGTHHSLYIVTRIDGRWGLQANSSYG